MDDRKNTQASLRTGRAGSVFLTASTVTAQCRNAVIASATVSSTPAEALSLSALTPVAGCVVVVMTCVRRVADERLQGVDSRRPPRGPALRQDPSRARFLHGRNR